MTSTNTDARFYKLIMVPSLIIVGLILLCSLAGWLAISAYRPPIDEALDNSMLLDQHIRLGNYDPYLCTLGFSRWQQRTASTGHRDVLDNIIREVNEYWSVHTKGDLERLGYRLSTNSGVTGYTIIVGYSDYSGRRPREQFTVWESFDIYLPTSLC